MKDICGCFRLTGNYKDCLQGQGGGCWEGDGDPAGQGGYLPDGGEGG